MRKPFTFLMLLFIFLFFTFAFATCSNEKTIETPEGKITVTEKKDEVEVRSNDGSITIKGNENTGQIKIKTEEGENLEVTYNKDKITEGFPQDIPIYAPSKITMSQVLKDKNAVATLSTKDDTNKVALFYKNALPEKGWSMEGEMDMGGMIILQGKKGENILNVSVVKGEAETNITLAITQDTE